MSDKGCKMLMCEQIYMDSACYSYTDNIPENSYTEPDSRIPKDLYEKWLAANNEYDGLMQRIMNELTGGSTNLNGIIWVYYRK